MKVRPLHDQLIVKLDPVPERKGSIIVLAGDEERLRTGIILRAGPGRWLNEWFADAPADKRMSNDAEVGDRVYFFRENFETIQGKEVSRIVAELEPGTVMIRARDLLWAEDPSLEGKLYLSEEQLNKLPEEVRVSRAGLYETRREGDELPRLHAPAKLPHPSRPANAAERVEQREDIIESDFVQSILGNNP